MAMYQMEQMIIPIKKETQTIAWRRIVCNGLVINFQSIYFFTIQYMYFAAPETSFTNKY